MDDPDLVALLERPMAPVDPAVRDAIDAGPIAPAQALSRTAIAGLLEASIPGAATGHCRLPDGVGYAAVRTPMAGVDAAMLEWWFDWHPHDPLRYAVWFPGAHTGIRFEPPRGHAALAARAERPPRGTIHHPVEDIGLGTQHLRIAFLTPAAFGFPTDADSRSGIEAIVCGRVGDDRRRAWHTWMCHVAHRRDDGIELHSRFWMGAGISPFDLPGLGRVLNRPALRRRLVPDAAPRAMADHCAREYAHLAAILPDLHARYGA